jgi:hypothetical protein
VGVVAGGFEQPVAIAAPRETPAHKIVRLRAKAAWVQRVIERMNVRVERLIEDYNEVREELRRTRAEQERTQRRIRDARRRLEAAKRLLGRLVAQRERIEARLGRQVRRAIVEERRRPRAASHGGGGPGPLDRPRRLHRRGAPDRLSGSSGRGGNLLLDCEGRDPRGPTPRSCV